MGSISHNTSLNFHAAKVLCILLVAVGHFGVGVSLWMPITVALFVFAFSSGFFTSAKYHDSFDFRTFWKKKLLRLGPDLLLIDLFLLGLFVIQGRDNLWTWQTGIGVLGLKGFVNWLGLPSHTPFGAGQWFFTLLLIFYVLYPALRWTGRSAPRLVAVTALAFGLCALGQLFLPMGHMLWLTGWGFVVGVCTERLGLRLPPWAALTAIAAAAGVLLGVNLLANFRELNLLLLATICVLASLWLKDARLPERPLRTVAFLSPCILFIYFLHSYLFVRPTRYRYVDMMLSLALIVGVSWVLRRLAEVLRKAVRGTPSPPSPDAAPAPAGGLVASGQGFVVPATQTGASADVASTGVKP